MLCLTDASCSSSNPHHQPPTYILRFPIPLSPQAVRVEDEMMDSDGALRLHRSYLLSEHRFSNPTGYFLLNLNCNVKHEVQPVNKCVVHE